MRCVLRARGAKSDVERFAQATKWPPCATNDIRGDPPGSTVASAWATVDVSEWSGTFDEQLVDAAQFLQRERAEIENMRETFGLESLELDFGINLPEHRHFLSRFVFPADLILAAAALGLGLAISIFDRPDDFEVEPAG